MITFDAVIKKFGKQGEKTGWTYIEIPEPIAAQLKPGHKSFRIKGALDKYTFEGVSILPMGGGSFIMALKADVRKQICKPVGAIVKIKIAADNRPAELCPELLECLADEPLAQANFNKLPPSHRKYYSNWIASAKTQATRDKRITQAVAACLRGQHYGQMIRELNGKLNDL